MYKMRLYRLVFRIRKQQGYKLMDDYPPVSTCRNCGMKDLKFIVAVWVKKDKISWEREGWCLNCIQDVNADYDPLKARAISDKAVET